MNYKESCSVLVFLVWPWAPLTLLWNELGAVENYIHWLWDMSVFPVCLHNVSWKPNDCDFHSQLFNNDAFRLADLTLMICVWPCEQRQAFPLLCLQDRYVFTAFSAWKTWVCRCNNTHVVIKGFIQRLPVSVDVSTLISVRFEASLWIQLWSNQRSLCRPPHMAF